MSILGLVKEYGEIRNNLVGEEGVGNQGKFGNLLSPGLVATLGYI